MERCITVSAGCGCHGDPEENLARPRQHRAHGQRFKIAAYAGRGSGASSRIHPSSFAFALASCLARARKWMSWIGALSSPLTWYRFSPVSALTYLTMQFVPSNVTTTSSSAVCTRKFRLVFILAPRFFFALGVDLAPKWLEGCSSGGT